MEILITPRLTIRPPIAYDADDIAHLLQEWDVAKMLSRIPWPYSTIDAENWLATMGDPEKQVYTIHRHGLIGVAGFAGSGNARNLGYWLGKPWHGHGFMREALTLLLNKVFADQHISKIDSSVISDNIASLKLQAGLGFEFTGEVEIKSIARKAKVQAVKTVLTREAWRARAEFGLSKQKYLDQPQLNKLDGHLG